MSDARPDPAAKPNPRFYDPSVALVEGHPSYIQRGADIQLITALRQGQFVNLLSSRKVGKSSLIKHTFHTLRQEGKILTAVCELTQADAGRPELDWYFTVSQKLINSAKDSSAFDVQDEWLLWWEAQPHNGPDRFEQLLRRYFLQPTDQSWVLAIDEIDTLLPCNFSADFFATLRSFANQRNPGVPMGRLTVLLSGVANPAHLIKDNRRTPYNLGENIALDDLEPANAQALLAGLGEAPRVDHPALLGVLEWTGGHPYLTQKVFSQLASLLKKGGAEADRPWIDLVNAAVHATLLSPAARKDDYLLRDIAMREIGSLHDRERTQKHPPAIRRRILSTYRRALKQGFVRDDALFAPVVELKLCGLLAVDRQNPTRLVVRNRVFKTVFNAQWIREEMPQDMRKWIASASVLVAVLAAMASVFSTKVSEFSNAIARADGDVPTQPYESLRALPWQDEKADVLMAHYWARRAQQASAGRPRDEAALLWFKSLSYAALPQADLQARRAFSGSLPAVELTFWHADTVIHAAFSEDGARIVTASEDDTARIWNAADGKPIGAVLQHEGDVNHAAFSADGARIVTASDDDTARIWNAADGKPIGSLQHASGVMHAAFSADGARIVTASWDSTARIWNAADGKPIGSALQHAGWVNHAAFSADGARIVTASSDNTARIWNAADGKPIGSALQHAGWVNHAAFSADGARIVTASWDDTARIWNAADGKQIGSLQHPRGVTHAAFSADGARIVTASWDNTARIWNAADGKLIGSALQHASTVMHAAFSADGARIVTASSDNTARIWNAADGKPIGSALQQDSIIGHAAFSADGARIVTASGDNTARIWNAADGKLIGSALQHVSTVMHAAFSADGARIVTASWDGTAWIWNAADGKPIGSLQPAGGVIHAAFSADGARIVTASPDKTARIWNAADGKPIGSALQHAGVVCHAAFSADGARIVTASWDSTARIWNAADGKPIGSALQHAGWVNHAAFSADGARIVTASSDNTARIWNAADGKPIGSALQHAGGVDHAAFSADGARIITTSGSRIVWWKPDRGENWLPEATTWSNAGDWRSLPYASGGDARTLRIVEGWFGGPDSPQLLIQTRTLDEAEKDLPELSQPPAALLDAYLQRFALKFESPGTTPTLVPLHAVTVARDGRETRPGPNTPEDLK